MRRFFPSLAAVAVLLAVAARAHADKPRKPVPAQPADQYKSHTTAAGITVAAQPGDVKESRADTRLDYFHHGFMPVRVIVTNNSDKTLELDQARINFIAADGSSIAAATDDDLQRKLFDYKAMQGSRIPLPGPLPGITVGKKQISKDILEDDDDFGFQTLVVAPHSSADGVLYYDMHEVDDPVLEHAQLRIRRLRFNSASDAAATVDLGEIEVPLSPTTPNAPANPDDSKVRTGGKDHFVQPSRFGSGR